jgi:hypothetical protein
VDEDHWLKLYNRLLAQEVMFFSLFHLEGQYLFPSPMLSLLMKKGYYYGVLTRVMFCFPAILNTFHPRAYHNVLKFGNGSWSILS